MTLNQASKKSNDKQVYSNPQDQRVRQRPKFKIGDLVRTADIRKVFSKGDSTNIVINYILSQKLYMIPSVAIELTI